MNPVSGDEYRKLREEMVKTQIVSRGVKDENVLEAMKKVPREQFILKEDMKLAFFDGPLSIGYGQTISQPYIVAYMTEMLNLSADDRVLEVGTGSGYQTAVLAEIAAQVYTIEYIDKLSERAEKTLTSLGCSNVEFRIGDGSAGWPEEAPFDAIMVTAAPEKMPLKLIGQLADGGRMIVPVGKFEQYLHRIVKRGGDIEREVLIGVRFVPMVGKIREND